MLWSLLKYVAYLVHSLYREDTGFPALRSLPRLPKTEESMQPHHGSPTKKAASCGHSLNQWLWRYLPFHTWHHLARYLTEVMKVLSIYKDTGECHYLSGILVSKWNTLKLKSVKNKSVYHTAPLFVYWRLIGCYRIKGLMLMLGHFSMTRTPAPVCEKEREWQCTFLFWLWGMHRLFFCNI